MAEAQIDPADVFHLHRRLSSIEEQAVKHDHALFGNGRPGLLQDMAEIRTTVAHVRQLAEDIKKDAQQQRRDQEGFNLQQVSFTSRIEAVVVNIESSGSATLQRLKQAEKLLLPIVDWKKGIILRLATMMGTALFIFGALWALFEQWPQIKAMLR